MSGKIYSYSRTTVTEVDVAGKIEMKAIRLRGEGALRTSWKVNLEAKQ